MLLLLQIGAVGFALASAFFWYRSTTIPVPPPTIALIRDGVVETPPYVIAQRKQGALNRVGAACAVLAAICGALAFYFG